MFERKVVHWPFGIINTGDQISSHWKYRWGGLSKTLDRFIFERR